MSELKVGIDIGPLSDANQNRGIGFYVKNLIRALKKLDKIKIVEGNTIDDFGNVDIVHYPTFDFFKHTLPIQKIKPVVVTIHDVTPLVFPKAYPPGWIGNINLGIQKYSLKNVRAVITDSKASANDLVKYLNIKNSLIHPIHLAYGDEFKVIEDKKALTDIKIKYDLPDKFVVYVGNVNWNKNLVRITEAAVNIGVKIVLIGQGFENINPSQHKELESYREFLDKFRDNNLVKRIGYMPTDDLVGVLNLAKACVYTTLYEGFGLPILEAQACGVPVVTSRVSSMTEVAGSGAVLVDPQDIHEISMAIVRLLEDKKYSNEITDKGFENITKFSWQKTANETIAVYKLVLGLQN